MLVDGTTDRGKIQHGANIFKRQLLFKHSQHRLAIQFNLT